MEKEEVWALDADRIAAFFREQPDAAATDSGFAFQGCRVTVTALEPRRVAGMALPQTRVTFAGEAGSVTSIHRRFLLRFLSAGG